MESPTRLSQSRFFRFGRLSKASRKSSSAYSNHSFSTQPSETVDPNTSIAESNYAASEIIYQQLNHRSISMGTLPPSGIPSGTLNPSVIYSESNNHVRSQPRLSQLQNLEAKMASIAVSLSGGRRTSGSLPHHGSLRSSVSIDAIKTASTNKIANNTANQPRVSSKQLRNELELLRKIVQEKDTLIQSLQQREKQASNMSNQHVTVNGTIDRNSNNNERQHQQIERRLQLINNEIEIKRSVIKDLRVTLQQTNVSDNIDARIRQAETEYQLEREETNLLNLQDEKRSLLLQLSNRSLSGWHNQGSGMGPVSLFRALNGLSPLTIILTRVDYDIHNPCFKLIFQHGSSTPESPAILSSCTVQWAREDLALKPGDKIIEINGYYVPGQEKIDVINRMASGSIEVAIARPNREEAYLYQIEDLSNKIENLTMERDALKGENLRLKHRISYLEEVQRDENLLLNNYDEQVSITKGQTKSMFKEDVNPGLDGQPAKNKPPIHRSEIRIQSGTSRQKPPRASKLKPEGSTHTLSSLHSDSEPDHGQYQLSKRQHSSLDVNRINSGTEDAQIQSGSPNGMDTAKAPSRIKASIVDRHFGHVIRVTHHHHPLNGTLTLHNQQRQFDNEPILTSDAQSVRSFDSFVDGQSFLHYQGPHGIDNGTTALTLPKTNQRLVPSPTQSDVRSDASVDLDHHGYVSDDHAISSSVSNYGSLLSSGKKIKPVPPRKPSFLYLNRASSLQSVNGTTVSSLGRNEHKNKQKTIDNTVTNIQGSKNNTIRAAISSNFKWNVLPSGSRNKSEQANRDRET